MARILPGQTLMNLAEVGNSLPVNPMAVMGLVNGFSGSVGSLSGSLGKLQQLSSLVNMTSGANHVYSPTDGSWSSQQLNDSSTAIAGTQGSAASLLQDLQGHGAAVTTRASTSREPP
jgi:hypothetical protein